MRRFLLIPVILGIAAALVAQSSAPSDSKPPQDPASELCTVMGQVVSTADGNPLNSTRKPLVADHNRSHHEQIYGTSSDTDGHFTLKNIPKVVIDSLRLIRDSWNSTTRPELTARA